MNLWKFPNVTPLREIGEEKIAAYEASESLASVAVSPAILIPEDVEAIAVSLIPSGGGKGKVQLTTDPVDVVKNGTVTWVDWDAGEVAAISTDVFFAVTAIRLSQTFAGAVKMTMRAQ